MSTPNKTLCFDFDGVLHDPSRRDEGRRMGHPYPEAREALLELIEEGYRIVIHSARIKTPTDITHVRGWCDYFQIPYHDITLTKPEALLYIDNRGWRHTSWITTLSAIATHA